MTITPGASEISASLTASPDEVENFAATARSGLLPACVPDRVTANDGIDTAALAVEAPTARHASKAATTMARRVFTASPFATSPSWTWGQ